MINKLENTAKVIFDSKDILSNTVETLLQLPPTLLKSVDVLVAAKIGDTLTYTVVITNLNLSVITNLPFVDELPEGCSYVTGSFKVNNVTQTATYDEGSNKITYSIPNIASLGVATVTFQVKVVEVID